MTDQVIVFLLICRYKTGQKAADTGELIKKLKHFYDDHMIKYSHIKQKAIRSCREFILLYRADGN